MSYNKDIQFLIVYIREAHPEMLKEGNQTGIIGRPKNLDERVILATECVMKYRFTMPMVIDGMDGKVNDDYQAWPVRVTITDIDGKVAFYAGRGPADFRIPPVERTLKKLIANGGRMPSPAVLQWGEPVDGLRCGIGVEPNELTVGEQVTVQLIFENTGNRQINLYYQPTDALNGLIIANENGQTFKVQPTSGTNSQRGRPFQRIAPGQNFETEIEGILTSGSEEVAFTAGQFKAVYNLEVDNAVLDQVRIPPRIIAWKGKLSSGTSTLSIVPLRSEGCIDCHGVADYHHAQNRKCDGCHVGQVGNDDFGVKPETCGQCHPREGVYGRRQILGPGGEFDSASRHIRGKIEDKDCLLCHDNTRHRNGIVSLIDPDSDEKEAWMGTRTEFCLTCHDGEPPANISFPAESTGSGFDKLKFLGSRLAQTEEGCSYCHMPHGSLYPSLLKNLHTH